MLGKKKSLAFVLALVMMLTLIPASAFATTSNSVTKTPTVASETLMPVSTVEFKVTDAQIDANTAQKIKLTLENGTWGVNDLDALDNSNAITDGAVTFTSANAINVVNATSQTFSVSDNSVEFAITSSGAIARDGVITLKLNVMSGEDAGEVKLKVDGLDSQISSGTYTLGVVGDGNTIATVTDKPKVTGRTQVTGTSIEIREVAVNSIAGPQSFRLTLPTGFDWAGAKVTGDMIGSGLNVVTSNSDSRDLNISFTANGSNGVRESITIEPNFHVRGTARLGDVSVQVRNLQPGSDNVISNATGLVVATYAEEGVTVTTVKEKDLPTIFAGREFKEGKNENNVVEFTLEENQAGALIKNRYVDFTFPEWVQVADPSSLSDVEVKVNAGAWNTISGAPIYDIKEDTSTFEWLVPNSLSSSKANEISFRVPVTVDGPSAGDIELTVDGAKAGVNEAKIVVGKAVAPITVETKVSDVRTGVQSQASAEILIKETEVGAIRDEVGLNTIDLSIDTNNQNLNFSKATVEVKAGDLELKAKSLSVKNGVISIVVDRESIKTPAEILIKDIQLTLDRTPAEGKYNLDVGGTALVDNADYKNWTNNNGGEFESFVVETPYVNVVTPADGGVNAQFVIGQSSYTANGVIKTMDAASYLDGASRTMVPIRYVAEAMGVAEEQVVWNQATQTATIFGKNIVSIKVGSNVMTSNGTPITMDTVAVNKAGRVYVPVRFVANALSANVSWDQAAQTATIFTVK